jgi:hypothetical protein
VSLRANLIDGDADGASMFDLLIPEGPSFAPTEEYLNGAVIREGDYEFTLTGPTDWTCKVVAKNGAAPLSTILLPLTALTDAQREDWGLFFFRVCNKLSAEGFARRDAHVKSGLIVIPLGRGVTWN